ncbi:MAG: hypothetical protein JWP52_709 [Rhizobacter sp.]|nr:hypothetical protein [Rhizobacter sp.]
MFKPDFITVVRPDFRPAPPFSTPAVGASWACGHATACTARSHA